MNGGKGLSLLYSRKVKVNSTVIEVHMFDDSKIVLNSDLIEFIEATPDTVISLSTGKKVIVKEKVPEIIDRIVEFRRRLVAGSLDLAA